MKILHYAALIFLVLSCNDKESKNTNDNAYLISTEKKLYIPIEKADAYLSFANQVYNHTLYRFSKFEDVIDVYSLNDAKKIKKYRFNDIGPNHISAFQGAAIAEIGIDSFLIANNYSQLYITYKDSVVLKQNLIDEDLLSSKERRSFGNNKLKPINLDGDIFLVKFSQYIPGTDLFFKDNVLMKYNTIEKKIQELNLTYPQEYNGYFWSGYHYMLSFTNKNKQLYVSFPINGSVYIYDTEKNILSDSITVTSKFENKPAEPLESPLRGREKTERYAKENIRYETINYEPIRKLFYRIIILPVDSEADLLSDMPSGTVSPFSIMVLDKDFKVLAEDKFPGKTYDLTDFFVTDKGLWISNNNPENPNFSEDHLSFTLFELVEKQK